MNKYNQFLFGDRKTKCFSILPNNFKLDFNLTRYEASAQITFQLNKEKIKALISAQSLSKMP